jgi:hypothetical protein
MIQTEASTVLAPFESGTGKGDPQRNVNTNNINVMDGNSDSFHQPVEEEITGKKPRNKSRRELPTGAVATLKAWLLSPEHFTHPYPTPQDQVMLMQKTGIDKKQLKNWFTNARRRIWKPMLKKQLEQGKLAATGTGGGVAVPGVVPGLMLTNMAGQAASLPAAQHPIQTMQEVQFDHQGNQIYDNQSSVSHPVAAVPPPSQYYDPNVPASLSYASSKNVVQSAGPSIAPNSQQVLSKTDSHAVLMELFARDQDLVRQATETGHGKSVVQDTTSQETQLTQNSVGATSQLQLGVVQPQPQQHQQYVTQPVSSQHPMKSQSRLGSVPTLNSWPHFSSVSSLNNLGTMPGVKSSTSLSAADLAKQGPVNTVGNLAQVKSVESMGKIDSYAFLEVFFGDRSSNNLNSMGGNSTSKDQRGVKRERDEDNNVGLSLEDESPAGTGHGMKQDNIGISNAISASYDYASSNPYPSDRSGLDSGDTLKRAYDDAMAARGLLSVSRSSEKLTDLVLPAKMQRTLAQEFIRQKQQQQMIPAPQYVPYQYGPSNTTKTIVSDSIGENTHQYPVQPPSQMQQKDSETTSSNTSSDEKGNTVEVPSATKCSICNETNVDTQLRPCGHMFREKCLKASLQTSLGAKPMCPVCQVPIQSALLAIPTEETPAPKPVALTMSSLSQNQAVSDTKS